jgi:hypothetical protein
VQWLFGKCAKRNKVQKIEEPEAEDAGSTDEFELFSNEEEPRVQDPIKATIHRDAEEAPHQAEAGEESEDDTGIEEDDPVEKAKMIIHLKNIKEQIKTQRKEEERTRVAEAGKLRKQKGDCLKLIGNIVKKHCLSTSCF